ncbi:hypothetical protein CHARACLAT_002042 [Characodon lateralis]|uniref:Uncharacterized protein n=1 Tax=Characodon lateralis TaxID=208331 RepID=A0ABU7F240_9TELE|nr:hypothetical protein [Characodon lateralis]
METCNQRISNHYKRQVAVIPSQAEENFAGQREKYRLHRERFCVLLWDPTWINRIGGVGAYEHAVLKCLVGREEGGVNDENGNR